MCKGGAPDGRDLRAHEVNLNQSLAVFTGLRANIVKVARKAEALDASSAETAVRQRSRLIGFVRNKIDCRERKAAFDSKGAQLRPGARSLGQQTGQGTGDRDWGQQTGDRELGGQGTGDRELGQGTGNLGQGQGPGMDRELGARK